MFKAVEICNLQRKKSKRLTIIAKNVQLKIGSVKNGKIKIVENKIIKSTGAFLASFSGLH